MTGPVSVVIPAYNAARFLAEALDSVGAQSVAPLETLVVDDGSDDGTGDLAESLGAVVIRHDVRRGVSAARNAAIARASGEFIALLDADDVWEADKLARQLTAMRAAPTAELCTAHFRYFLHPGVAAPAAFDPATEGIPQPKTCPSTWLIRRDVFQKYGYFREDLQVAEDIDWYSMLRLAGAEIVALDECLVRKRVHDTNISGHFAETNRQTLDSLRELVSRRREHGGSRS